MFNVMHVHVMFLSTLKYSTLVYLKFDNEARDVGMHNILFLLVLGGCYKTFLWWCWPAVLFNF